MRKQFKPYLTCNINRKGVLDIDTVKGCSLGMAKYPNGGCYGLCYAAKMAKLYNYDFTKSTSRKFNKNKLPLFNVSNLGGPLSVFDTVKYHKLGWFRVGTMGDPCHNWLLTAKVCEWLCCVGVPVVITKHWLTIPDNILQRFKRIGVVFNTSISALDTENEIEHRLRQFNRLKLFGIKSVLRIVSCKFGATKAGKELKKVQDFLFKQKPLIDNPLRIPRTDKRVVNGDILVKKYKDLKSEQTISKENINTYIGDCWNCPDQCGVL